MSLASEPLAGAGAWIKAMVDGWAGYSEDEETLTRVFLSPQHKACAQAVMSAMRAAGMTARIDAISNVVGRYEAAEQEGGGHEKREPAARTHIRTEEHTCETQLLKRLDYAGICLKKKT